MAKKNKSKAKAKNKAVVEELEKEELVNGESQQAEESSESTDNEDVSAELLKVKAQLKEAESTNLRLQADLENIRRRKYKEISDAVSSAQGQVLNQVILIFDDIERMLGAAQKTDKVSAIKSGIEGIQKKLKPTLEKMGLKSMETKVGGEFDSNFHEAVTTVPVEEEQKEKIIDVISKGYTLGDKIIRFAKVIIGEWF